MPEHIKRFLITQFNYQKYITYVIFKSFDTIICCCIKTSIWSYVTGHKSTLYVYGV